MAYKRQDGRQAAQEAVATLQAAVRRIDAAYDDLDADQMGCLRAMASHLMLILEDE